MRYMYYTTPCRKRKAGFSAEGGSPGSPSQKLLPANRRLLPASFSVVENSSFQHCTKHFQSQHIRPQKLLILVENSANVESFVERLLKSWKFRWKSGKKCGFGFSSSFFSFLECLCLFFFHSIYLFIPWTTQWHYCIISGWTNFA